MWTTFVDNNGRTWGVNQLGLWILIREYLHATMLLRRATVVRETRWIGPDLVTVDINFDGFRREKDSTAPELYQSVTQGILDNPDVAFGSIIQMRRETRTNSDELRTMQQGASREIMANIETSVSRGELGVDVARTVRDISATTLVVGATFLSGGTALAVLGGGSALKGTSTYQDTGNVGAAVLDASATFTIGAIGIGAAGPSSSAATTMMSRVGQASSSTMRQAVTQHVRQNGAIILVGAGLNAQFEMAKGLVQGQTMSQALRGAATRFGVDVLTGGILGPVLDKCALPVAVRLVTDNVSSAMGDRTVSAAAAPVQAQVARAPESVRVVMDAAAIGNDDEAFVRDNVLVRL